MDAKLETFDEVQKLAAYLAESVSRQHNVKLYLHHRVIALKLNIKNLQITQIKPRKPRDSIKYRIQVFSHSNNNNNDSEIVTDFSELLYHFVINIWAKTISNDNKHFNELLVAFETSNCDNISELLRKFDSQQTIQALKTHNLEAPIPNCISHVHCLHRFSKSERILEFLSTVSNLLNGVRPRNMLLEQQLKLERCTNKQNLVNKTHGWINCMNPQVKTMLRSSKHCKYYGKSTVHLLRAIRNLHSHFYKLPKEVQLALGEAPDAFLNYWTSKFPLLVNYIWESFKVVGFLPSLQPFYKGNGEIPIENMTVLQKCIHDQFSK